MRWSEPSESRGIFFESYSGPQSGFLSFSLPAMGTESRFLLRADDSRGLRKTVQEVFDLVHGLEQKLSKFLPESEVSLVNRLAAVRPVAVGEDLLFLLRRAREAWELTEGAFDPTVGGLLAAWGLVDLRGRLPADEEIEALLRARGMDRVIVDDERREVRFDGPGVSVDLGGIAKGYAADRAAERLRRAGIEAGAVIAGRSTLLCWGAPPGEARWRVGVVHPEDPGEFLCTVLAEPGAISSSGAYERFVRVGARDCGHVIDPRTGRPARCVKGATVWTSSALLGDVLSTALFVLGERALEPGGCAERLARAWAAEDEPARVSVLLIEPDTRVWGGLRIEERHQGPAAFVRQ
ncbi:MAG: FAD:protein FMN transferase [Planctomycetes bacterium]|nr:FAD:protein FMN transferase [Planctomycetota bacterium]